MSVNRAGWFEAFQTFSQFYPRLSAAIAFGTMAAVGRMIPTSRTFPNRTTYDSAEVKPLRQALPPAVKKWIAEYVSEKLSGAYGHSTKRLRIFRAQVAVGVGAVVERHEFQTAVRGCRRKNSYGKNVGDEGTLRKLCCRNLNIGPGHGRA